MKAIEMHVRKLSTGLEKLKFYKILSTLTLFNKWLMVSVRPLSNGCTQELGVYIGDSPKQLPNYIYNSTDTYHEPTDK